MNTEAERIGQPGDLQEGDTNLVIRKLPHEDWTDFFSGKLGHVFGGHEETMRFLDELRSEWERE